MADQISIKHHSFGPCLHAQYISPLARVLRHNDGSVLDVHSLMPGDPEIDECDILLCLDRTHSL